jgi:hypothetical protein
MDVDLRIIAVIVLIAIGYAGYDDRRWLEWLRGAWSKTVGSTFAKRRTVEDFFRKGGPRIRISVAPNEHCQRHINTGSWT